MRLDVWGKPGRDLASKYGIRAVPSFLIFDGKGNLAGYYVGIPDQKAIIEVIESLNRGD
ncbi:MAG: thioredoxin family protein [Anaerolineae bacterium]|nr:thioredoxin family protein [Anaerolineae bacterium]